MQAGQAGVLGVFAQLATVAHEGLGRVLAANYRSMLVVLIVQHAECRQALESLVAEHRCAFDPLDAHACELQAECSANDTIEASSWICRLIMPDVLCISHAMGYRAHAETQECPGWQHASPIARSLQQSACMGSDPPLPLALPHSKALQRRRGGKPITSRASSIVSSNATWQS